MLETPPSDTARRTQPERMRFGLFEADLGRRELLKDGMPVRLSTQPFKALTLLARRAGQVVTREELRREIWGDETFVDFEGGLNFCIKQVRRALGDDATSPRFIRTLPRQGYSFIAPVQIVWPDGRSTVPDSPPVPPPPAPPARVSASRGGLTGWLWSAWRWLRGRE